MMEIKSNFLKYDIDLKEWIDKLYSDIEKMKKLLEENQYNITRADFDLTHHYQESIIEESEFSEINLEAVLNKDDICQDFIIQKYSESLIDSNFFVDRKVKERALGELLDKKENKLLRLIKDSFNRHKPKITEFYHITNERVYRLIINPGTERKMQLLIQDITLDKQYLISVKRCENIFSKAQEISSNGFFQYNTFSQELMVTEGVLNIFGCPRNPNIAGILSLKDYLKHVHEDDKEQVLTILSDEGISSNLDFKHRIRIRDQIKYIHIKGSAFYDQIKDTISLIGTVEDITEFKNLEKEYNKVNCVLDEIEKLSGIAYWEYDFLSDRLYGRAEAKNILGLTDNNQPLSLGDFLNQVSKDQQEYLYENYHKSLTEHRDWEGDIRIFDKIGTKKDVHIVCHNQFDYKGKPLSSKGFLCNETKLKKYKSAYEELKKVKSQLAELERSFETKISEELNTIRMQDKYMIQQHKFTAINEVLFHLSNKWLTSLNILSTQIHNWLEAYLCGELDDNKVKEIRNNLEKQIKNMITYVGLFRKQYSDKQVKKVFKTDKVIKDIYEYLRDNYESEGIKFDLVLKGTLELEGVSRDFHDAIYEIIKDSHYELINRKIVEPQLQIETGIKDDQYCITIRDNAGGISPAIINRIFEPYFTSRDKRERSGLGLYLSKIIIEKNFGGTIEARNYNSGALFEIRLPLNA